MAEFWKCQECDYHGTAHLSAPNPFDPAYTIAGCPKCKEVGSLRNGCDEPGCKRESSCGFPTPNGYRRTCYDHSDFAKERAAGEGSGRG